jgi:hypothetical protein
MTNELMQKHHECLSILRTIQEKESDIINCEKQLKRVDNPIINQDRMWYIETIATTRKLIEVLFGEHELLIKELT